MVELSNAAQWLRVVPCVADRASDSAAALVGSFRLLALEQHAPRYLGPLVLLSVDGRSRLAFYTYGVSSLEEEEERLNEVRFPALGLDDFVYARSGLDPTDLDPFAPAFARSGLELFWQTWACPH